MSETINIKKNITRIGGLRSKGYFKKSCIDKPLISVITIVLNNEKFIAETIKSVLCQPYSNLEYIIIDGGSTDNTLNIIREYESSIDYWTSEKDSGIYDAMNRGCRLAYGSGIIFLNSGDKFVGNVFNYKPEIPSLLPCKINEKFKANWNKKISSPKYGMPTSHQAMIFKNKKIMYDLNYKYSSDYDYYIRHGMFLNMNRDCLGYVLYDNNGISKKNKWKRNIETILIINKYFGILQSIILILKKLTSFFKFRINY